MEHHEKEVYFGLYCSTCQYRDESEDNEPCRECLLHPSNEDSHQPINFHERVK